MPSLREILTRRRTTQNALIRVGYGNSWSALDWGYGRTLNSVYGNPTGFRCVSMIQENLARPTFEVFNVNDPPEEAEPLEGHSLLSVLNRPSPGISGTAFMRNVARDLELAGKSVWIKTQGKDSFGDRGPLQGLRRLPVERVTVFGNDEDELLGFVYRNRVGQAYPLLPQDCLYIRFEHPERGYDGIPPAMIAGLSSESDTAAARFNYDLLSNDGALPGYITVEGLTPSAFAEWKGAWESGEYPGKTRFMSGNAKYMKVGQTNQELTYDRFRLMSQEDTCRAFGIAKVLIDPTDATFSNMGEARANTWQSTYLPKLTLIADQMTVQIGEPEGVRIGFRTDDIEELQESQDAKVLRLAMLTDAGILLVDEARDDLGYDPLPEAPPAEEEEAEVIPLRQVVGGNQPTQRSKGIQAPAIPLGSQAWQTFDRRVTSFEARVHRRMQQFFIRQGNSIVSRLRGGASKAREKAVDPNRWWDGTRWISELENEAQDWLGDTIDAFGTLSAVTFGGPAFDLQSQRVQRYLRNRSQEISGLINDTTSDDVRRIISELDVAGENIDSIADAIASYFAEQGPMRAERVARTEVIGAANYGQLEAARQAGVSSKTWLAAADERVDSDCAELDGTTVDVDDGFGEVDQPPLHVNCRCTLTFNFGTGGRGDGEPLV